MSRNSQSERFNVILKQFEMMYVYAFLYEFWCSEKKLTKEKHSTKIHTTRT